MNDARLGLATVPSAAGITPSYLDCLQWTKARLALARFLGWRVGGEGIYAGGAAVVGDLTTGGTEYPAVTLIVNDDSAYPWPIITAAATAITFVDTSGAGALYAVVKQLAGVTPAAADGGFNQVSFVAQLAASAAPLHSLKLGTGTIAASAFTTYTPEAILVESIAVGAGRNNDITIYAANGDANRPALRYDASSNAWQVSNDGITWSNVAAASDLGTMASQAANNVAITGGAVNGTAIGGTTPAAVKATTLQATGVTTLINGAVLVAADARFGPPTAGAHSTGAWFTDIAGTWWYCTSGGTPGTWELITPGRASVWTGGGATDPTSAANWNGGALLDGYRVWDTVNDLGWVYDTGVARWLSDCVLSLPTGTDTPTSAAAPLTASSRTHIISLPILYDCYVVEATIVVDADAGTWDASNKWTVDLRDESFTEITGTPTAVTSVGWHQLDLTPDAGYRILTQTRLETWWAKTGAPGSLYYMGVTLLVRLCR